jgi:hypothetical protein
MASSKSVVTARTRGGTPGPVDDDAPSVSPARWLGVGLVLGSLIVAMAMARTSTVQPSGEPVDETAIVPTATVTPAPQATGEGVPTELPTIAIEAAREAPSGGLLTSDREVALVVDIPETVIRTRQLSLEILRDGAVVETIPRPGDREEPTPVQLKEGANILGARLLGPAGNGPTFELPIELDTRPPTLEVHSPRENQSTEEDRVTVRGQSDPGAALSVLNRKTREEREQVVGPDGSFEEVVFLEPGENVIRIRVSDVARNANDVERTVDRAGDRVRARLTVEPRQLSVRRLPAFVRITARLLDKEDRPVEGAEVTFTLSVPGQPTQPSPKLVSKDDGTATWRPEIVAEGIETGKAQITMVARLPVGGRIDAFSSALDIG